MVIAVVPPRTLFHENCNRTKCQQFLLKQTSSQRPNSLCVYESRRTKQPSKVRSRFKQTVFAFHLCFITENAFIDFHEFQREQQLLSLFTYS